MRTLRPAHFCALLAIATAVTAVAVSRPEDWAPAGTLVLLVVFALIADRFEIRTPSGMYVTGSMPVFVLVAVLWGPAPASALGLVVALAQWRKPWNLKIVDVAVLPAFPLVTGLAVRAAQVSDPVHHWPTFMAVVGVAYMLSAIVNFALIAGYMTAVHGRESLHRVAASW